MPLQKIMERSGGLKEATDAELFDSETLKQFNIYCNYSVDISTVDIYTVLPGSGGAWDRVNVSLLPGAG